MSDFNDQVIADFNANGGKPGGHFKDAPVLLLHAIGAKSGVERTQPLMFLQEGDGPWYIFASYAGGPKDPAWFHNLVAHPDVDISVGDGATIERDIRRTQDRIGKTVDKLEEKLNPRNVAESLIGDDNVDTEFQRTLAKRGHGRVVGNDNSACCMSRAGDGGEIAEVETGIRRRLDKDQAVALEAAVEKGGRGARVEGDAELLEVAVGENARGVVAIGGQEDAVAGFQQGEEHGRNRGHA